MNSTSRFFSSDLIIPNSTASNATRPHSDIRSVPFQVVYSLIAALSIILNAIVLVVLVRKRRMLTKPHNVLILNLAITDAFTEDGPGAEIFCRLIQSRFLLYTFGKASLLTVLCLAVERWVSMVKPIFFRTNFSKKRVIVYLALIWITSTCLHLKHVFEREVNGRNCVPLSLSRNLSRKSLQWFTVGYITVTFYLPLVVTWFTFSHIWYVLKTSSTVEPRSVVIVKRRLLSMCALTALLLTVCWLPSETSLIMQVFGGIRSASLANAIMIALSMFNSCINPLVYYFTNMEYRREIERLFCGTKENFSINSTELSHKNYSAKLKTEQKGTDRINSE